MKIILGLIALLLINPAYSADKKIVSKKQGQSQSVKANISIPASALIAEVLNTSQMDGTNLRWLPLTYFNRHEFAKGEYSKLSDQYMSLMETGPTVPDFNDPIELSMKDNKKFWIMYNNNQAKQPFGVVLNSYNGWEITEEGSPFSAPFFGNNVVSHEEANMYFANMEASAEYTNAIFTEIAGKVKVEVYKNPDDAKKAIRKAFKNISDKTKQNIWHQAVVNAMKPHGRQTPASTTSPEWTTSTSSSYKTGASGLVWTKSGVKWFGEGALSGKEWKVAMESSLSEGTDSAMAGEE